MKNIDKIRAALDRCEPSRFPTTDNPDYSRMVRAEWESALAALAELERAAAEPVAWVWNDLLGIPHTYVSPTRPTWPDAGSSPAMAAAINVRPLYTTPPPAPVAEIGRLRSLVDGAMDIVEIWQAESPSQIKWKRDWLAGARDAVGSRP